ncbi:MAG TPA: hypothetical protein VLM76_05740 [Patescibacteria group bacterium]|nr:hypothetical protein [Patescibacteria group bacterium]
MSAGRGRYGPNSVVAERLLDDLAHLHPGALAALAAAGGGTVGTAQDDADVAARSELRGRLREIASRGGRLAAVRAIGDEVATWAASTTHWFPAGVAGSGESTQEIGSRLAAAPIVLDAAYAVVLEDLLADWELDLLLAPWEHVVGSPFGDAPDPLDDPGDDLWDGPDDDPGGATRAG